jgi:transcription initiation factor TFIID subunit 3
MTGFWITSQVHIALVLSLRYTYHNLGLKAKYDKTEDASRYNGTILGEDQAEPKIVIVEGGNASSLQEWAEQLHKNPIQPPKSSASSRRQSSDLSSLGDASIDGMDFD